MARPILQHIRKLVAIETASQASDAALLERFVTQRDESAFAFLLKRHGPMVLRLARRLVRQEQDAEDIFQATFLLLARKAGLIRKRHSVSSWLYGVAYRLAGRSRQQRAQRTAQERRAAAMHAAKSRATAWRDLQELLEDVLAQLPEKYRTPLILCYLEGKTQEQAAQQLGCPLGTVRSWLARGRSLLRRRLARRGVALSSEALATALLAEAVSAAAADLPPALAQSTLKAGVLFAAGTESVGLVAAPVVALVKGGLSAMLMAKIQGATTVLLALTVLVLGSAVVTERVIEAQQRALVSGTEPATAADRSAAPKSQPVVKETQKPRAGLTPRAAQDILTIHGRVLDPDGKAMAGAQLYLAPREPKESAPYPPRATTETDGQFTFPVTRSEYAALGDGEPRSFVQVIATAKGYGPDWAKFDPQATSELTLRLVKDDMPLTGRVLDLQGQPVAGADVRLLALETTPEEDLTSYLNGWKTSSRPEAIEAAGKVLHRPFVVGLPQSVKTAADGHFRLIGCGRERIALVAIEAPTIETDVVRILPRPASEIKKLVQDTSEQAMSEHRSSPPLWVYGIPFDHVAGPTKRILGTVRDKETGEPVAGIWISGSSVQGGVRVTSSECRARTDAQGRYTLRGLPKSTRYRLAASPGENQGYPSREQWVNASDGLDPMTVDFEMVKGVEIRGRITDKVTGKPVRANLRYMPLKGNTHPATDAFRSAYLDFSTKQDGTFRAVVAPGPGLLLAYFYPQNGENPYPQARLDPADRDKGGNGTGPMAFFVGFDGRYVYLYGAIAYRIINPPADGKSGTYDLQLDPGLTQTGTVLGPDGQPLPGVLVSGLRPFDSGPLTLQTATFTVLALNGHDSRELFFLHKERKLGGHLSLRGDEKIAPTVKLEPLGTLRGRILDDDGQPRARVQIQLSYAVKPVDRPGQWWDLRREPVTTDQNGCFGIEYIIAGVELLLRGREKDRFLPFGEERLKGLSLGPGEDKDLGDIQVKLAPE